MQEIVTSLKKWLNEINDYKTPRIDSLPDLGLYMDQVINYLEKALGPLADTPNDKTITPSMINNYVKGDIIPNPIQKKYSRSHLMYIIAICTLKQILPISDINKVINLDEKEANKSYMYDTFRNVQDDSLHRVSNDILKKFKADNFITSEEDLSVLALKLAIESYVNKLISEKIIFFIDENRRKEIESIKQKTIIDDEDKD